MSVKEIFERLDYGPAPESTEVAEEWLAERESTLDHFIGGHWVQPGSGDYFDTTSLRLGSGRYGGVDVV